MNRRRVAIIGVGHVGSALANSLLLKHSIDTIYLAGSSDEKLWAERNELLQCALIIKSNTKIEICRIEECIVADIIVIAASQKYRTGMRREDFLISSSAIVSSILSKISTYSGTVIIVSNPVDFVTFYSTKILNLDRKKVIGAGTIIDSYRLQQSLEYDESIWCIGEHGGMTFVPMQFQKELPFSSETIRNLLIENNIIANDVMKIKGMTNWAIAAVISKLIHVIMNDLKTALPVSQVVQFPFLESEVCLGYPAYIGRDGIIENMEIMLTLDEQRRVSEIAKKQNEMLNAMWK